MVRVVNLNRNRNLRKVRANLPSGFGFDAQACTDFVNIRSFFFGQTRRKIDFI